ncbi:hypothetical protein SADUNF_Sadunf02G0172300 [Salix dunnii]|uniref:Protein NIM1-INTERACTING 1 n=1 Tax=Salix dunnii TaxID=1413687 RepID=A0A835TIL8_9ROSI|nr:hypothetical protein SADUNF_Sadunf02G0172300 [Salix dunnii]
MENKKSEASAPSKGDLDEQEDQKMEQFFALIRSFHEARSRWKDELVEKPRKKKKVRVSNDEEPQSSWVPTFQWEDFTEDIKFIKPPLILPSPCNNRKKLDGKKPKEDDDLELRLAL